MICRLLITVFSLQVAVSSQFCPNFSATFVAATDRTIDDFEFITSDPELTFFRDIMGFRDEAIQHSFEDAFKFFNNTYGLDFSLSQPNEQNEYFFGNAKLMLFQFRESISQLLVLNNWIQAGNTRTTCRTIHSGGFRVTFAGDQLLYGSYGGAEGKPAGVGNSVSYGFTRIDTCDQSPVIIQFQTATPIRREPVDGATFLNFDVYNRVLGQGKAVGVFTVKPDPDNEGKFRFISRSVYTFPAN